ncbi:unnamed protein product [Linum trigynum]|uniref:Secreted protein n=1 Tax=Linum trigynum TaxID=586398 RepID=A0AAV2CLS6_9ROSI
MRPFKTLVARLALWFVARTGMCYSPSVFSIRVFLTRTLQSSLQLGRQSRLQLLEVWLVSSLKEMHKWSSVSSNSEWWRIRLVVRCLEIVVFFFNHFLIV